MNKLHILNKIHGAEIDECYKEAININKTRRHDINYCSIIIRKCKKKSYITYARVTCVYQSFLITVKIFDG